MNVPRLGGKTIAYCVWNGISPTKSGEICGGTVIDLENDNGNNTTKELIFMEYVNICKILYLVNCLWVDQTLKLMIDTLEKRNKSSKAVVALKSLYKATCGERTKKFVVL